MKRLKGANDYIYTAQPNEEEGSLSVSLAGEPGVDRPVLTRSREQNRLNNADLRQGKYFHTATCAILCFVVLSCVDTCVFTINQNLDKHMDVMDKASLGLEDRGIEQRSLGPDLVAFMDACLQDLKVWKTEVRTALLVSVGCGGSVCIRSVYTCVSHNFVFLTFSRMNLFNAYICVGTQERWY